MQLSNKNLHHPAALSLILSAEEQVMCAPAVHSECRGIGVLVRDLVEYLARANRSKAWMRAIDRCPGDHRFPFRRTDVLHERTSRLRHGLVTRMAMVLLVPENVKKTGERVPRTLRGGRGALLVLLGQPDPEAGRCRTKRAEMRPSASPARNNLKVAYPTASHLGRPSRS